MKNWIKAVGTLVGTIMVSAIFAMIIVAAPIKLVFTVLMSFVIFVIVWAIKIDLDINDSSKKGKLNE